MPVKIFILISFTFFSISGYGQPGKKFDTTMKIGKAGYKIYCNNKGVEKNNATITPIGFESTARDVTFEVKGRINRAEVDDLNNDGYPDLVVYVNSPGDNAKSLVIGVSSDKNQGFIPIYFPDILDDQKLKTGYVGKDQYYLMEGTLMRRFPIYNTTDTANTKQTGLIRQIQYKVVAGDRGELKFKIARSYDFAKQP